VFCEETWQLEDNGLLRSGTLKKRPRLHGGKELLPICPKKRALLWVSKQLRLHERKENDK
jgi:hypothetical protein